MPDWLREITPRWLHGPLDWLVDSTVLSVLVAGSIVLFVLSVAGIPWFVARVPADYFSRRERAAFGLEHHPPAWRTTLTIGKNLLGLVVLLLGVTMLVLPGQGLVTMAVGLFLLDFPGKRRLQRRLVGWPPVLRALNAIRRRAGREPLELPKGNTT